MENGVGRWLKRDFQRIQAGDWGWSMLLIIPLTFALSGAVIAGILFLGFFYPQILFGIIIGIVLTAIGHALR
jgi:hypothetical protein